MTKLIIPFRSFANGPKNEGNSWPSKRLLAYQTEWNPVPSDLDPCNCLAQDCVGDTANSHLKMVATPEYKAPYDMKPQTEE
jgi:hypothetical protein